MGNDAKLDFSNVWKNRINKFQCLEKPEHPAQLA